MAHDTAYLPVALSNVVHTYSIEQLNEKYRAFQNAIAEFSKDTAKNIHAISDYVEMLGIIQKEFSFRDGIIRTFYQNRQSQAAIEAINAGDFTQLAKLC